MAFAQVGKILLLVSLLGLECLGEENVRSTRTLASFFGYGNNNNKQQQPQQVQPEQNVHQHHQHQPYISPYERPLVYQVKYYDTDVKDVNKNNIDKAGEVRQEIGQQRVYYYTTGGEQSAQPSGGVQVPQGYLYLNPVVGAGAGQAQAYIVGQVGDQQVLVPCPIDYGYSGQPKPLVEKVAPVPIKPAVVQPVTPQHHQQHHDHQQSTSAQQVKGREQPPSGHNNQPSRDVPSSNQRPVPVPEVVYNPYAYYGNYGSYQQYMSPYSPYASGPYQVGYNYPSYNYNQVVSDQQVFVVPQQPMVSPQGQGMSQGGVNPYVYVYRGGLGGVTSGYPSYVYPYVVPVSSYIRPKETVEGSSSTRVNVSAQGQQVNPDKAKQQHEQKKQPADSHTSTTVKH